MKIAEGGSIVSDGDGQGLLGFLGLADRYRLGEGNLKLVSVISRFGSVRVRIFDFNSCAPAVLGDGHRH